MGNTPQRWASARHRNIHEINTWPWLSELEFSCGRPVDLSSVPARQWDAIADAGCDAVWLMGVWQRSPAGKAVALANSDLVAEFESVLPDWSPDDVVGSAYSIRGYEVDDRLGGRAGLAAARSELAARGIALILDFVPNHIALDHLWAGDHPEYFVRGTADDLATDPQAYVEIDGVVFANGKDPYFPAWSDTLQLNAFDPGLRDASMTTLRDIADQCDGVRCDMAMLMMNDVFAGTWGDRVGDPPADEYWPLVIGAVRQTHPEFTFIAEAYWDLEFALQQQGFDFCYDKTLYDLLVADDVNGVQEHLGADPGFQSGLVRFIENHDEPRAAAIFASARHRAMAVASLTQAGARLVYDGQLEGRKVRVPVFLSRTPREPRDDHLASFYRSLFEVLRDSTFRNGTWALCRAVPQSSLVAWSWDGDQRWLIVVNLSAATVSGSVEVPWEVGEPELELTLGPWQWHIFRVNADGMTSQLSS